MSNLRFRSAECQGWSAGPTCWLGNAARESSTEAPFDAPAHPNVALAPFPYYCSWATRTTMTTNDTVSDARGQEQASPVKGHPQRMQDHDRIEDGSPREPSASPSNAEHTTSPARGPAKQAGRLNLSAKTQDVACLTPAQRQRLDERKRVEKVVRDARRARLTVGKRRHLTAAEREAIAKVKAETWLERSTRVLVVAALAVGVALIAFSIHALVQRSALNRDVAGLVEQTQRLADQQASTMSAVQTTLDNLSAAETTQATQGEERLAGIEAATAAGFADVSERLGKIDALTEAVVALSLREAKGAPTEAPAVPSAFTEREITLPSGRRALLAAPEDAQRAALLIPGADAAADPLPQVAEYLAARGCVVLRLDPTPAGTAPEDGLAVALGALDVLLEQPEAAGEKITIVAYGESAATATAVAQARPEVAGLVLLAPSSESEQRLRQVLQVLGPLDETALADLESWISAQTRESP
jgi:hypothetical protein